MIRMALENRLKVDLSTLQMMFTVDRADHIKSKRGIEERLKLGEIVVSDRYLASTLAFGYGSNLDVRWLSVIKSKFFLPDITFFLDVKPETCIKRINASRPGFDLFEKKDQLRKIYEGYMFVNKILKRSFVIIDGEREIKDITDDIVEIIKKHDKYKKIAKKNRT
jgi:dTMP kinase